MLLKEEVYRERHAKRHAEVMKILREIPEQVNKVEDYMVEFHGGNLKLDPANSMSCLSTIVLEGMVIRMNMISGLLDLYLVAIDLHAHGDGNSLRGATLAMQIQELETAIERRELEVKQAMERIHFMRDLLKIIREED